MGTTQKVTLKLNIKHDICIMTLLKLRSDTIYNYIQNTKNNIYRSIM